MTTPEGVNQRELDFELALSAAVDLALAQSPDLIVWLGDIFDHPRPTYRAFRVAQRELAKIRDHGTALVAISGNHDTPRLPGTGSPYSVLSDAFPEMQFAARLTYERIELPGLVVHAVPQMLTVAATLDALDEADKSRSLDRVNLLLTHPRLAQLQPKHADINELEVDEGALRSDLVLLGHYHFHTQIGRKRMWYAGSTDTFTFADDPAEPKGIVVLDTDTGACRHVALDGLRPLVTLETIEALGLPPAEVEAMVLDRAASAPRGSVARLYVENVEPEAWRLLDAYAVRDAWTAAGALHLTVHPSSLEVSRNVKLPELQTLDAQWNDYVAHQDLTNYDRPRIARLGTDALARAVEEAG